MNTAYVYKWTHKPSMKWYIGSHKGHVKNYICSSKYVKEQIKLQVSSHMAHAYKSSCKGLLNYFGEHGINKIDSNVSPDT